MGEWVQEKILERGPGLEKLVCDWLGQQGEARADEQGPVGRGLGLTQRVEH